MMVTFAQASSFFIENPDLLAEFALTNLNISMKLKLLTLLKKDILKCSSMSQISFGSSDEDFFSHESIRRPMRTIIIDHLTPKLSPAVNRAAMAMRHHRTSYDSTNSGCKTNRDSSQSMGFFVNQLNLPSVLEENYEEVIESFTPKKPHGKVKKRSENCSFGRVFSNASELPSFLKNLQLAEEEPLSGYSFEKAHPYNLGKGVRLASSVARSELSTATISHLSTASKKWPSRISKESLNSLDLDSRSHLPDSVRHLIERIIKRQFSRHEIIHSSTSVLTEHADVDLIHLHLRGKDNEVHLLKSTCSGTPDGREINCSTTSTLSTLSHIPSSQSMEMCSVSFLCFYFQLQYFPINFSSVIELLRIKGQPPFDDKTVKTYGKQIVQAEKCILFLVDLEKQELISTTVDHGDLNKTNFVNVEPIRVSLSAGVLSHAVRTGECVVSNAPQPTDAFYYREGIFTEEFRILNAATVPIKVRNEVVAVLQLFNKTPGEFDTNDVENLEDFSVFCGLVLYISKMYEKMFRSEQKCRITMEIMLHHNLASDNDVVEYSAHEIPDSIPGITEPLFSPWHMPDEEMPAVFIYMVHDVVGKSVIDLQTLIRFTLTVRKNYRDVIYHNWFHGFSVAHGAYVEIKREDCKFTQVEKLCILIAALCHDLDHRGTDNSYQRKKGTPLATLYSTSILEHHHFNMTLTILQVLHLSTYNSFSRGTRYFALSISNLEIKSSPTLLGLPTMSNSYFSLNHTTKELILRILMIIKHAILSTDLGRLEASKEVVVDILDKRGAIDWDNKDHRMATVAIVLPVADLCSMYKPWEVHKKVVLLVMEEMWAQGDEEKRNGFIPMDLMNRDLYYQIPEMQSNFYKVVCLPLFRLISRAIPSLMDIPNQAFANFSRWMEMCLLPESVKRERLNELIQRRSQGITANTYSV
ncbi:unnamed protein product [Hydatigera taeniaeformis]|uniref:Phosphodiesterase n=1 Tax=Hydatigena taeniaeformis TaxID=6205 RepID=A0A0R3X2Z0_HYDTA|nr:unnamed protein product [Hydatigera taeniaeformis]